MLYSDSNAARAVSATRGLAKRVVVSTFYRAVDGALFNSANNRRYHERYGRRGMRLYPCRLPVDLKRLTSGTDVASDRRRIRSRYEIPTEAFVVVFSGKLAPHKRAVDLLRAVSALEGTPPVWALFVGDGPDRPELERIAAETAGGRAVFAGFVNQTAIGGFYAAADACALPSSSEAHGLAVTEATAFGLPVLVSDQVGCIGRDDVARPGVNAIVHECGDISALAEGIDRLRRDAHLCADMGRASLAIAATQDVRTAAHLLCDAVIDLDRANAGSA